MGDDTNWYYQAENGPGCSATGPLSTDEVGALIRKGSIRSDTLVRFGIDARWHAASSYVLLKRFLEPVPSPARPRLKRPMLLGLGAAVLVLLALCFLQKRAVLPNYEVLPLSQREGISSTRRSPLSVSGIILHTNRVRAQNAGLQSLVENGLLDTVAAQRCDDMIRKQYFSHYSPSGEAATDVAQRAGYHYRLLAENIAMGDFQTDEKVVAAWMQSPGHRKNILSDDCSEIGVAAKKGRIKGEEVWVVVQIFGEQSPSITADSATAQPVTYASPNPGDRPQRKCQPPDASLLDDIAKTRADLDDLTRQAASLMEEISADRSSGASRLNTSGFNQKIARYNELVTRINTRRQTTLRMISAYNQSVDTYNSCIAN